MTSLSTEQSTYQTGQYSGVDVYGCGVVYLGAFPEATDLNSGEWPVDLGRFSLVAVNRYLKPVEDGEDPVLIELVSFSVSDVPFGLPDSVEWPSSLVYKDDDMGTLNSSVVTSDNGWFQFYDSVNKAVVFHREVDPTTVPALSVGNKNIDTTLSDYYSDRDLQIMNLASRKSASSTRVTRESLESDSGALNRFLVDNYFSYRDSVLESADWLFATTSVLLEDKDPSYGENLEFGARFRLPNSSARVMRVSDSSGFRSEVRHSVRGQYVYCDLDKVYVSFVNKYVDSASYSELFVKAVSLLLASDLAITVRENSKLSGDLYDKYMRCLPEATSRDGGQATRERIASRTLLTRR